MRPQTQQSLLDGLALAAVTLLSAVPFITRLGFYSDDWGIVESFHAAAAQNRWPWAEILHIFPARPVHGLYSAVLFGAFGLDPAGYHVVAAVLLAASAVLFYLLLLGLGFGRQLALASSVILIVLPQLSTVRAWFSAGGVALSLAFMLLSLHGQLSFARTGKWVWAALALVAAVLSLAAYEIFGPLLAGFALALTIAAARKRDASSRRSLYLTALGVAAIAIIAFLLKLAMSPRAGALTDWSRYAEGTWQLIRPDYDWRIHSGLNVFAALNTHFLQVPVGWVTAARHLVLGHFDPGTAALAAAGAALAAWRIFTAAPAAPRATKRLLMLGAAAFVLGHALFLIVPVIVFTPTGIGNRVQAAAALGVAMIFAAALATLSRAGGRLLLPTLIAAITFCGTLRLAEIQRSWAQASDRQHQVLDAALRDLAPVRANSTVILDGVCPYRGAGVVFETWWDTGPALSLRLGRIVAGDVVSPRMRIDATGLATSIYRQPVRYAYGPHLYAYDVRRHMVSPLPDRASAEAYFTARPPLRCPVGYVARGAPI